MTDIIIIAVIAVIVGLAAGYVYKAKKSGKKCIGCPDACNCSAAQKGGASCGGCCGCGAAPKE
ncbi:MAG: FeoB-associated Cys-rich membrane protein [Oscillospiraceae bacterium]|nr:FeoB-associated Cys-rich membrane protein [Oscillospiraceae bacterium]